MTQPSGKTRYIIEVDSKKGVAAYRALKRAVNEYGAELKKVKNETGKTGKETEDTGNKGVAAFKKFAGAAGLAVTAMEAIRAVARQLRKEWEFWEQRRETAAAATVDFNTALNRATFMQHPDKGITRDAMVGMIERTAGYTGLSDVQSATALGKISSAVGPGTQTAADVEAALAIGGRAATMLGQQDQAGFYGGAMIDIMKRTGESAMGAFGMLGRATSLARVIGVEEAAKTYPQALTTGALYGADKYVATAMYGVLTNVGLDLTGSPSATAFSQLARNFGGKPFVRFEDVPVTRKGPFGTTITEYETQPVQFAAPLALTEGGRERPVANWMMNQLERAREGGAFERVGRGAAWADRFLGAIPGSAAMFGEDGPGLAGMVPTGNEVSQYARTRFRSFTGLLHYGQRYWATATPEMREAFAKIHSRGRFYPIIEGLLGQNPEMMELLDRAVEEVRSYGGGGFEEYGESMLGSFMDQGGEVTRLQALGEAATQRVARGNRRYAMQDVALKMLEGIRSQLPEKSRIGTDVQKFLSAVQFGSAHDETFQDSLLRALRVEAEQVMPKEVEEVISGPGTAHGIHKYYDPGHPAAFKALQGVIEAVEAMDMNEFGPKNQNPPAETVATEEKKVSMGLSGARQMILVNTAATPWYPGAPPLAAGISAA
jgi:hypothetical protein